MFYTCCILIKLSLIICVLGTVNVDYMDRNETERKLADLEGNINKKLNKLESNTLNNLISYIDNKVDTTNKKITQLEEINTQTWDIMKKEFLNKIRRLEAQLPCKEEFVNSDSYTSYHSLESLNHATLRRNSTGHLTHFETHIAVQADERVRIRLSGQGSVSDSETLYDIDVGCYSNMYTDLDFKLANIQHVHTPDILSYNEFRAFYIKIDDGKLEFGKEGDSPLLSFYDAGLGLVNNFLFHKWGSKVQANIRYDCPAPVQELSCKVETVNRNSYTSSRSMEALKYATLKRNSTGELTHFEMHIAVKADERVRIRLSGQGSVSDSDILYDIDVGCYSNTYTDLDCKLKNVQHIYTPGILSSTEFRVFYIKIDDGKLEFGKEGENPLMSYYDARLALVNFFQFHKWGNEVQAHIRYDCPAPVQG